MAVEPAVFLRQAEHFVQPAGELGELDVGRRIGEWLIDDIDVAAAGGNRQLATLEQLQPAGFQVHMLGNRELDELVKVLFLGGRLGKGDARNRAKDQ